MIEAKEGSSPEQVEQNQGQPVRVRKGVLVPLYMIEVRQNDSAAGGWVPKYFLSPEDIAVFKERTGLECRPEIPATIFATYTGDVTITSSNNTNCVDTIDYVVPVSARILNTPAQ